MFASRGFFKVFEYVGMFVSLCVLVNPNGFANVMGIISHTSKLIYQIRFKLFRNRVFKTKTILDFIW